MKGGEWTVQDDWTTIEGGGELVCMYNAATVMFHLGSYLMTGDEKIRVTIECDPEAGRFTVKREVLNQR